MATVQKGWMQSVSEALTCYLNIFNNAFGTIYGKVTGVGFFASIILYYIQDKHPEWIRILNHLDWQIPLGVFAVLLLLGLIIAPYNLQKEERKRRDCEFAEIKKEYARIELELAEAIKQRISAEQELQDERTNKQDADQIVLKEAYAGFRNLNKTYNGAMAPRNVLNEKWVQIIAEKHGRTTREIDEAIDRLDGKFHWQV